MGVSRALDLELNAFDLQGSRERERRLGRAQRLAGSNAPQRWSANHDQDASSQLIQTKLMLLQRCRMDAGFVGCVIGERRLCMCSLAGAAGAEASVENYLVTHT